MPHIDWSTVFFFLFAILTVGSAVYAVVLTKNVVRAAFALMGSFGGVAGLYGVMGADFLMVTQLIVYVGGILILILFGVMMSRRAANAELPGSEPKLGGWLLVLVLSGIFLFAAGQIIFTVDWGDRPPIIADSTTPEIGKLFLGEMLLPFEFISVLLLGALIGAVILARKEVRE